MLRVPALFIFLDNANLITSSQNFEDNAPVKYQYLYFIYSSILVSSFGKSNQELYPSNPDC